MILYLYNPIYVLSLVYSCVLIVSRVYDQSHQTVSEWIPQNVEGSLVRFYAWKVYNKQVCNNIYLTKLFLSCLLFPVHLTLCSEIAHIGRWCVLAHQCPICAKLL